MRNQDNIKELLTLHPDCIGFIFYAKSARFVGEELAADYLLSIPAETQKVGVFVNENQESILAIVQKYRLNVVQLHGEEPPELCRQLKKADLMVWKAFALDENFNFSEIAAYEGTCDFYLFDTKGQQYGGNGTTFNWDILENYTLATPFFLSGGIDLDHVPEIKKLKLQKLKGIDINSRFEKSPALKDNAKIAAFFKQLRQVEA
jgi:phosphoribosylanthranilate isomerase